MSMLLTDTQTTAQSLSDRNTPIEITEKLLKEPEKNTGISSVTSGDSKFIVTRNSNANVTSVKFVINTKEEERKVFITNLNKMLRKI